MHLQESGEMYLETIYLLSQNSPAVRSIDIVEHMGYSKPSVSRAIGILKNGRLLAVGTVEELKKKAGSHNFETAFVAIVKEGGV